MRWSLATSLILHVGILLIAVGVFQSPEEYVVEELESVPVDIVSLEEFSKRQETQKDVPEPEPEKKIAPKLKVVPEIKEIAPKVAEEVKQAAREPQPEPEPKPAKVPEPVAEPEPPKPEPLEELIKKTEDVIPEPEPEAKPEEKAKAPVPLPRTKPKQLVRKVAELKKKKKKKKPAFNPNDVAALLNKIDEARAAPSLSSDLDGAPKRGEFNSTGTDDRISANELDWLRQRIGRCWNVPAGARDAQNLIVKIRIQMDPLGNIMGQPRIINNSNHPVFDAAARSALAAVIGCQPYDKLPAEKYSSWKDMIINFDPSLMLAIN